MANFQLFHGPNALRIIFWARQRSDCQKKPNIWNKSRTETGNTITMVTWLSNLVSAGTKLTSKVYLHAGKVLDTFRWSARVCQKNEKSLCKSSGDQLVNVFIRCEMAASW